MTRTRILFLPCFFGMPSHFIPLVKLYQRLPKGRYDVAFFLPRMSPKDIAAQTAAGFNQAAAYYYSDEFLSHFDVPTIDLEQRFGVVNELAAYRKFSPDLIVDDSSLTTALARRIQWRPRLAIARTGVFGSAAAQGPGRYPHSLSAMLEMYRVPPPFRFEVPRSIDAYFEAEAHIIPGVRSLESLPGLPDEGRRAFYSGPLTLDEREETIFHSGPLSKFIEAVRGRRIAYVTLGVDAAKSPHAGIGRCLRELLRRDFAVVTNVEIALQHEYCFHSKAVPMHDLCSRASLIVHVAGSATYHYPILHGKPAITLGTHCRDREQIAWTLCARGLSQHIPAPATAEACYEFFVDALDRFESSRAPFDAELASRLSACRLEMADASARFDLDAAIEAALAQGEAHRAVM